MSGQRTAGTAEAIISFVCVIIATAVLTIAIARLMPVWNESGLGVYDVACMKNGVVVYAEEGVAHHSLPQFSEYDQCFVITIRE